MQIKFNCKFFSEKHNTSRHYMWRFIADLSAVINTEWAEKKIKTVQHSAKSIRIIDMMETRTKFKDNFRTIIQNLRTTSPGQNLLVLIKERVFGVF